MHYHYKIPNALHALCQCNNVWTIHILYLLYKSNSPNFVLASYMYKTKDKELITQRLASPENVNTTLYVNPLMPTDAIWVQL